SVLGQRANEFRILCTNGYSPIETEVQMTSWLKKLPRRLGVNCRASEVAASRRPYQYQNVEVVRCFCIEDQGATKTVF
ncbi:MAG: hypothetical protein AAF497_28125, partial [Planctomycetota bacterium]